jgi:hypothetical protein
MKMMGVRVRRVRRSRRETTHLVVTEAGHGGAMSWSLWGINDRDGGLLAGPAVSIFIAAPPRNAHTVMKGEL